MDYFEAKCSYCPKVFTCKQSLEKHKLHVHIARSIAHDCEECGKQHKRNPHVKRTCEICNTEVNAKNYTRHKREVYGA